MELAEDGTEVAVFDHENEFRAVWPCKFAYREFQKLKDQDKLSARLPPNTCA